MQNISNMGELMNALLKNTSNEKYYITNNKSL